MRWRALCAWALAACTFNQTLLAAPPEYTICRTASPIQIDGKLTEPAWIAAKNVGLFQFAWYQKGKKEQTVAKMVWDDEYLYVGYLCEGANISATRTTRGSSVWKDDCVEVFTAPNAQQPHNYFNIEMNVNAVSLEGHHPKGYGSKSEQRWRADGLKIATTVHGTLNDDSDDDRYWILEAAIPFKAFAHVTNKPRPNNGDVWFLNLNRLGGVVNEQFSQWSPGSSPQPQYHAPQDFGRVTFSQKTLPFPQHKN